MKCIDQRIERLCRHVNDGRWPVVISLEVGDTLEFRRFGCRLRYRVAIATVYALAVRLAAAANRGLPGRRRLPSRSCL